MPGVDIGREHGYVVVVGNVESAMLRHLCAQRAGVGHGLSETVSVAVRQIELGALGGQPQRGRAADAAGRTGDKTPLSSEYRPAFAMVVTILPGTIYACPPQSAFSHNCSSTRTRRSKS